MQGPLPPGLQGGVEDLTGVHCDQFVKHLADEMAYIHHNVDFTSAIPEKVLLASVCPLVTDSFPFAQPEGSRTGALDCDTMGTVSPPPRTPRLTCIETWAPSHPQDISLCLCATCINNDL